MEQTQCECCYYGGTLHGIAVNDHELKMLCLDCALEVLTVIRTGPSDDADRTLNSVRFQKALAGRVNYVAMGDIQTY